MSTEKLHIFKSKFFRGCFYPLRDIQTEIPVDYCSRCGGETGLAAPEGLLLTDYICSRCIDATARRNDFLN